MRVSAASDGIFVPIRIFLVQEVITFSMHDDDDDHQTETEDRASGDLRQDAADVVGEVAKHQYPRYRPHFKNLL